VVDEQLDDGGGEPVVGTGHSDPRIVLVLVDEAHLCRAPREPRQVEVAHQLAAVHRR